MATSAMPQQLTQILLNANNLIFDTPTIADMSISSTLSSSVSPLAPTTQAAQSQETSLLNDPTSYSSPPFTSAMTEINLSTPFQESPGTTADHTSALQSQTDPVCRHL